MSYNWAAMSARQDRATDRQRVRKAAQRPENRGKRKFRKKKGSKSRIRTIREADRYNVGEIQRIRSRAVQLAEVRRRGITPTQTIGQAVGVVGQAVKSIVTNPLGASETTGLPLVGGIGRQAVAGAVRNLPGIGRYLGRTDAGVGRYLAGQFPGLGRALPWLAGVSGGVALEKLADWGLDRMGEPRGGGRMYPVSQMPARRNGGASLMQQRPLGQLSRGQEFPGGPFVVKTWDTYPGSGVTGGGAWPIFALLSDGRIVVSKPDGSWKVYRPKKNLVISSNPRLRDIRKLDKMHKRVTGMMKRMVPRPQRRK